MMHEMVAIRYLIWPLLTFYCYIFYTPCIQVTLQLSRRKSKKSKKMLIYIRWVMSGECIKIKISGRDAP